MLWTLPQPIQTWKQVFNQDNEKDAHGRWFDLFFDLLFVGVAFNVGHLIEHLLHDHSFTYVMIKSLSIFFVLFSAWLQNVLYYARFDVHDTFHKMLDVFEFTAVGIAAFHSGGLADHHGQTYQATGFAIAMWICGLITTWRCAELTRSKHANARTQAIAVLQVNGLNITLCAIAIGIGLNDGKTAMLDTIDLSTADTVLGILVLAAIVPIAALFGRVVLCRSKKWQNSTVPVHISFLCHRVGEFTMLMLGESVLSCVTFKAPITFNGGRFHIAAISAFVITTALMYEGYSAASFHAEKHVMRCSALGGVVWLNNTWVHSFALICVGVCLRIAMGRGEERLSMNESLLFSGSLVASFLFAQLTEFLHTLDGRPGGDSLWISIKKLFELHRLIEFCVALLQLSIPWWSLYKSLSAYDEVVLSGGITLVASALQAFDTDAHELEGRFHKHEEHGDEDGKDKHEHHE